MQSRHSQEVYCKVKGINFSEIIERIKYTVDQVDGQRGLKKVFITHDWGSVFAY